MDGFIVIDKPAGITSHDVVHAVRRITGEKKAGHTGTLDPFATGVLPVALGEGTKAIRFLDESLKEYRAVMRLGEATDTQDSTGVVIGRGDWQTVTRDDVARVAAGFAGRISQIPPMFSALKQNGVPLYKLARRGTEVTREPREVEIHSLIVDRLEFPEVAFTVRCSRGTYVRTLAHDMGSLLGCGAHLVSLQRTISGPFELAGAVTLERLALMVASGKGAVIVISPNAALGHLPDLEVNASGQARLANGIIPERGDFISFPDPLCKEGGWVRISRRNTLLAVAEMSDMNTRSMRLIRVFNVAPEGL